MLSKVLTHVNIQIMPRLAHSNWGNKPRLNKMKMKVIPSRPLEAHQLVEIDKAEGTIMLKTQANQEIQKERLWFNTLKLSRCRVMWENLMNMMLIAYKERQNYMRMHIIRTWKYLQKRELRRKLKVKLEICPLKMAILRVMMNWPDTLIDGNLMN